MRAKSERALDHSVTVHFDRAKDFGDQISKLKKELEQRIDIVVWGSGLAIYDAESYFIDSFEFCLMSICWAIEISIFYFF